MYQRTIDKPFTYRLTILFPFTVRRSQVLIETIDKTNWMRPLSSCHTLELTFYQFSYQPLPALWSSASIQYLTTDWSHKRRTILSLFSHPSFTVPHYDLTNLYSGSLCPWSRKYKRKPYVMSRTVYLQESFTTYLLTYLFTPTRVWCLLESTDRLLKFELSVYLLVTSKHFISSQYLF